MVVANAHNNDEMNSTEDELVRQWYNYIKSENNGNADILLANIKMVQTLYGKSPRIIAQMKPEDAYNFVLEMVRSLQSDGRSFSYIDGIIKAINDWLKFNNVEIKREISLSNESINVLNLGKKVHLQPELAYSKSKPFSDLDLYDKSLLIPLKEKSDMLLRMHDSEFVDKLRDLETILSRFDPAPDSMITDVDNAVNSGVEMDLGAYYLAAYSSTKDPDKALIVYKLTNSLMRYIALTDSFYETGDKDSLSRANSLLEEVIAHSSSQLRYSIKLSVEKFWPFWIFENMIRQKMLAGESFSDKELRYFILFKSSDTPLLYCNILDNQLESFNPNIATIFHYNQALIDIIDDYYDIEQDLQARMPNIFFLAASHYSSFKDLEENSQNIRDVIMSMEVRDKIFSLVEWFKTRIDEVSLPAEYSFLRNITTDHIQRLKSIIH